MRILKENDFKESEKADAQNLKQRDLKIVNYHTLHNRGIGTLKQSDHKYNEKVNPGKDSFDSFNNFLFKQMF